VCQYFYGLECFRYPKLMLVESLTIQTYYIIHTPAISKVFGTKNTTTWFKDLRRRGLTWQTSKPYRKIGLCKSAKVVFRLLNPNNPAFSSPALSVDRLTVSFDLPVGLPACCYDTPVTAASLAFSANCYNRRCLRPLNFVVYSNRRRQYTQPIGHWLYYWLFLTSVFTLHIN